MGATYDMTLRDAKTEKAIDRFLKAYEQIGTITGACDAAGVSREAVYLWDDNNSMNFNTRFRDSQERHADKLEQHMFETAMRLEPKHNPTLLIFALNGAKPEKYRVNQVVSEDVAKELMRELRAEQKKRRAVATNKAKGMLPEGSDPEVPDGQG